MYRRHDQRIHGPLAAAPALSRHAVASLPAGPLHARGLYRQGVLAAVTRGTATCSLLLTCLNCSAEKNHELRERYAATLDDDREGCVNPQTCRSDPGPKPLTPAQCRRMTEGYEYLTVWNYEGNSASFTFQYDDRTTYNRRPFRWEPETVPMARCGQEENRAYHTYGGPFIAWGGGFGGRLENARATICGDHPEVCSDVYYEVHGPNGEELYTDPGIRPLDLRNWDGISFWARRGPDSQTGIRVWLADSNLDEDIAFARYTVDPEAPRTCERIRRCDCRNHSPCTKWEGGALPLRNEDHDDGNTMTPPASSSWPITYTGDFQGDYPYYFCWDPETDVTPVAFGPNYSYLATVDENGFEERHDWCGRAVCEFISEFSQSWDPQFNGRPCTEYTQRTGLKDAFCFDPETDPPPPPTDQQCGDGWMKAVSLTTDWQFFRIPFTELLQQGWAKEFHEIKLDEISSVRFIYNRGYIDYWIDDVAFYRKVD